jgi:hypothetical protein
MEDIFPSEIMFQKRHQSDCHLQSDILNQFHQSRKKEVYRNKKGLPGEQGIQTPPIRSQFGCGHLIQVESLTAVHFVLNAIGHVVDVFDEEGQISHPCSMTIEFSSEHDVHSKHEVAPSEGE